MGVHGVERARAEVGGEPHAIDHMAQRAGEHLGIATRWRPHGVTLGLQMRHQAAADVSRGAQHGKRRRGQARHRRSPTAASGWPAYTVYASNSPRTMEPAPTTQPRRNTAPSSSTQLAPIHTSSSITMPPLLDRKP